MANTPVIPQITQGYAPQDQRNMFCQQKYQGDGGPCAGQEFCYNTGLNNPYVVEGSTPGIYICSGRDSGGECNFYSYSDGACQIPPSGPQQSLVLQPYTQVVIYDYGDNAGGGCDANNRRAKIFTNDTDGTPIYNLVDYDRCYLGTDNCSGNWFNYIRSFNITPTRPQYNCTTTNQNVLANCCGPNGILAGSIAPGCPADYNLNVRSDICQQFLVNFCADNPTNSNCKQGPGPGPSGGTGSENCTIDLNCPSGYSCVNGKCVTSGSNSKMWWIVGGVIIGVIVIILLIVLIYYLTKKKAPKITEE